MGGEHSKQKKKKTHKGPEARVWSEYAKSNQEVKQNKTKKN